MIYKKINTTKIGIAFTTFVCYLNTTIWREEMKKYSVKEVADVLGTNPETVRRWIRTGKLNASQDSRKEGNTISENELQRFLKSNAKYGTIAASSMAFSPVGGLAVALGGIVGTIIADQIVKEKEISEAKVNPKEVAKLIQEEILKHQAAIKKKKASILEIEKEIEEEEKQVSSLKLTRKAILERIEKENADSKGELSNE
jgi:excisionase family DNA binding protein